MCTTDYVSFHDKIPFETVFETYNFVSSRHISDFASNNRELHAKLACMCGHQKAKSDLPYEN